MKKDDIEEDKWYDAKKYPFPKNGAVFVIALLSLDGSGDYSLQETFFEYAKNELNEYQLFDIAADEWMEDFMFGVGNLEELVTHWKILGTPNVETE